MLKNYIKSKISNYLNGIIMSYSKNIKFEMERRALKTTVNYIEKNMYNVNSVNTRYEVHNVAISNISIKDGIVLEFGVYKGDTINYIAKKLPNYNVYGFDSFEGLPDFWRDGFNKGAFKLERLPDVRKNVTLIKGLFENTIDSFLLKEQRNVSYLHIDCDLYSSTKTIFEKLKNRIIKGTVIVFDEYFNYPGWENHEYKAFQEFIEQTQKKYQYLTYNYLHEQVALIIL